ncbi:hypothetical protein [Planctomycetes bacterium Poly30]|uniref:hypothetical protein n=1 Tax=Saltatorellus ferox TaxID=2528018 RepID=UPI0011A0B726
MALGPFAWLVQRFNFVTDDAFITFRYSRNFAEGKGLVYNLGVDPPVEGYSEFLWALLMGLGFEFGWAPETFSRVLSIGFGVLCVGLVVSLAARRFATSPVAVFGTAALVGCAPPLGVWATGGMATMPAASLGVLLVWLLYGRASGAPSSGLLVGLVASLLALMRADAAIVVALILGPAIVVGAVSRRRELFLSALFGALVSATAFGLHVAWRYSYYDDWLPNTARAKLGFSAAATGRGADYVISTFLSMPGLFLAFAGGLVGLVLAARRIGAGAAASAGAVIVGVTAYAILAGGDFMAYSRFLVPAIPMAALAFGALLASIESRSRIAAAVLAIAGVTTTVLAVFDVDLVPKETQLEYHFRHNQRLGGVTPSTSENEQWQNMRDRSQEWSLAGRALGVHAPPNSSVVFGAVGAIGYYSNLFIYDRNGLVTREVAMLEPHEELRSPGHDKVVPPAFFAKYHPTYLNVGVCSQAQFPPVRGAVRLGNTERDGVVLWAVPGR